MKYAMLVLMALGLSGCLAASDSVLCAETTKDRQDLTDGLRAHPETPDAVGEPAVSLLITLKVCGE